MKPPSRLLPRLRDAPDVFAWPVSIAAGAVIGALLAAFIGWATSAGARIADWFQLMGGAFGAGIGAILAIGGAVWIEDRKVDRAELAQITALMDSTQYAIDATASLQGTEGSDYTAKLLLVMRAVKVLQDIKKAILIPDFTIVTWFIQVDEAVDLVLPMLESLVDVEWGEAEFKIVDDSVIYLGRTLTTAYGSLEARRLGTRFGDRID